MISGVNHNLVARPYAELPSLDDLLKKRWDSGDSILLIDGPRDVTLPFRGEAITDYRRDYSYDLNVHSWDLQSLAFRRPLPVRSGDGALPTDRPYPVRHQAAPGVDHQVPQEVPSRRRRR